MNAAIICGSGPSLGKVPYGEPGHPLVVVSTAIRRITEPPYWVLLDPVKEPHGQQGALAAANPNVKKIVPKVRQKIFDKYPNVEFVEQTQEGKKYDREVFDGKPGVVTGSGLNRSMLFAIQWASKHFDTLIFAGLDMRTNLGQPWVHDYKPRQRGRINSISHNLRMEMGILRRWAPIAKERGYTWLSWTPESPIEEIMEKFKWPVTMAAEE